MDLLMLMHMDMDMDMHMHMHMHMDMHIVVVVDRRSSSSFMCVRVCGRVPGWTRGRGSGATGDHPGAKSRSFVRSSFVRELIRVKRQITCRPSN